MLSAHKSFMSIVSSSSEGKGLQQSPAAAAADHPSRGWNTAELSFVGASSWEIEGRFSSCTTSGSFSSTATNTYGGVCSVGLERLVYTTGAGTAALESDEDRRNRLLTARFLPKAQTGWRPEEGKPTARIKAEQRLNEWNKAHGKDAVFFVREPPLSDGSRRSALSRKWERFLASAGPGHARFGYLSRRWDRRWNKILDAVEKDQQQVGVLYFHHKLGRPLLHADEHSHQ